MGGLLGLPLYNFVGRMREGKMEKWQRYAVLGLDS